MPSRRGLAVSTDGNGLALTPPMGFNDWNAYGCNVSENLVKQTADKIVSSGLAAAEQLLDTIAPPTAITVTSVATR